MSDQPLRQEPLAPGDLVVLNREAGHREHLVARVLAPVDQFGYVSLDLGTAEPKSMHRDCLRKLVPGRPWYEGDEADYDATIRPIRAVEALERIRQKYSCTSVIVLADGYQLNCTDHEGEETFTRSRDTLWDAAMDAEQGMWMK